MMASSFVSPPLVIRQPGGFSESCTGLLAVVLRQKKATTSTVWPTHRGESRERCTVSPLQFHAARRDPARFLRCRSVCNRALVGQAPRILAEMLAVVVVRRILARRFGVGERKLWLLFFTKFDGTNLCTDNFIKRVFHEILFGLLWIGYL